MKPSKFRHVAVLAFSIASMGCNEAPDANTVTTENGASRLEAAPLKGEIYRSVDGLTTLTLISRDELELRERGTTFLCKYSKHEGGLRVIVTAMGTTQVLYFKSTENGLLSNDGQELLSPNAYAATIERNRIAREQEQKAQRDAEERKQLAKARERQSRTPTKEVARFPTPEWNNGSVIVMDTQIKTAGNGRIDFSDLKDIKQSPPEKNAQSQKWRVNIYYRATSNYAVFNTEADLKRFISTAEAARQQWREKYSDVVQQKIRGLK